MVSGLMFFEVKFGFRVSVFLRILWFFNLPGMKYITTQVCESIYLFYYSIIYFSFASFWFYTPKNLDFGCVGWNFHVKFLCCFVWRISSL